MYIYKENKSKKFFIALITILPLTIIGILFTSEPFVFAQDSTIPTNINYDIKEHIFGTNTELERVSRKPKIVYIKKNNYVYRVFTVETDARKILKQYRIDIASNDHISINTPYILDGSIIKIIRTEKVIEDINIDVPFETEIVKNPEKPDGEQNILQEGVLGVRTKRTENYYEDGILKDSTILQDNIVRQPIKRIVEIGTSTYSLDGIEKKGYNCEYWGDVVDNTSYTNEEKEWLKFVMYCESGCNAESQKDSKYKGLFQWDPYWWRKQFSENIFDGYAQISHTIEKYRAGGENMWPTCNSLFEKGYRH